jgi:hypothetical protein
MLKRLEEKHGKCAETLTQKASTDAQAVTDVHTPSVLETMMLLQQVKKHEQATEDRVKAVQDQVKSTKKVALGTEKDNNGRKRAHEHDNQSSCGHVPRHRR